MKLLLYCTKEKPYLYKTEETTYPAYPIGYHTDKDLKVKLSNTNELANLNGKIIAECDFEVEKITPSTWNVETERRILKGSCLKEHQLFDYIIKGDENESQNPFYAIHIKNLHIFDEPRELSDYSRRLPNGDFQVLGNAPQNMMKCCEIKYIIEDYILISIRPEWLCKILNGEKTIEVRKKVLKEMLEDE